MTQMWTYLAQSMLLVMLLTILGSMVGGLWRHQQGHQRSGRR
jgi:hypothetical protein